MNRRIHTEKIELDETGCFSSLFIDYMSQKEELRPFYRDMPVPEHFQAAIDNRNFKDEHRDVLVRVLKEQYEGLSVSERVSANIERLKNRNAFTITTGHQLNIFTGPLYFIYKIVTVINACKALKERYPEVDFVPVYWMASEDHDFEEINHFYFDRERYEWQTDQTGAVGRFDPSGLLDLARKLPKGADIFEEAYKAETLTDAARYYVNELFGEEGIVVVDADDRELKRLFTPVMEDDLFQHSAHRLVDGDTQKLSELGYKTQLHAREINFFYLDGNIRERIERTENGFHTVDSDVRFSEEELKEMIREYPDRFSPNVILRPLYQEVILPNLAYVGGPSEVVYWLQLKSVFEHFGTAFPLLMPRNFAVIIPEKEAKKWDKTGLSTSDLFLDMQAAFTKWVQDNSDRDLSYEDGLKELGSVFEAWEGKATAVDPTLKQHLEALKVSFDKKIRNAEKKLLRAEKKYHTDRHSQIRAVKEALFPGGSLQERHDNFLNFYLEDPGFIRLLLDVFDPFDYRMCLVYT